jgi:L-histidine N-alpha-methyltransferase
MSVINRSLVAEFAAEVRRDLALDPKQLQSKYLYDALGSSLFDAICRLPWYRITRAESRLLSLHADAIVTTIGDSDGTIVELGCGSGEKLVLLAEALQGRGGSAHVHLIDISSQALEQTEQRLGRLHHFSVVGHQSTYEVGLRRAVAQRRGDGPMLVLLLGSNLGNFDTPAAAAFLDRIRRALAPGDQLLLGADLVKSESALLLAYDDPLGVTAAFNRNLLVRINRELGADFDPAAFGHHAFFNRERSRIEMHLVSERDQRVRVGPAVFDFRAGESIHTENSYKYDLGELSVRADRCGLRLDEKWTDPQNYFAVLFLNAK